jgi:putative ABC transport system permease protein
MLGDQTAAFRSELENIPGVSSASVSDYLPIANSKRNGSSFYLDGKQKEDAAIFGQAWAVDEHYLTTLEINLLEGRDFDGASYNEDRSVIVNQQMVETLNLENPIGKKISRGNAEPYEIVGLIEDFNFNDLKSKVRPLAMYYANSNSIISIKIDPNKTEQIMAGVQNKWKEFLPYQEPRISFMDESFAMMYDNVSRMRLLFSWFTGLTILIACLGLFTLSAYIAEQRKKELSIRKILGASFQQIFTLLTKQFIALILISLLIAIPTTIYFMSKWLQDYEYKINISWEIFALAGMIAILIAIISTGYHAIRSAMVNPVVNLQNE